MVNSGVLVKLGCAMVVCMVVGALHAEAAVTCGLVAKSIAPCKTYLKAGGSPPGVCCTGIKSLVSAAATTADRRTACACLKTLAPGISGLNYGYAAALPGKCGTKVTIPISPSTDCSKVN